MGQPSFPRPRVNPKNRIKMRRFLLLLAGVVVGTILLLLCRLPLLEQITPLLLKRHNIHLTSLELSSLSFTALKIDHAAAEITRKQQKYTLEISKLSLHYTLRGLIDGTFDQLAIKEAFFSLPTVTRSTPERRGQLDQATLNQALSTLRQLRFPVQRVTVEQLRSPSFSLPCLIGRSMTFVLQQNATSLQATITARLDKQERLFLNAVRSTDAILEAELRHFRGHTLVQHLQLSADAAVLRGTTALVLNEVADLLPLASMAPLAGKLEGTFALHLTGEPQFTLSMHGEAVQLPWFTAGQARADLHITLDHGHTLITQGSQLQLHDVHHPLLAVESINGQLDGTITLQEEKIRVKFTPPEAWQIRGLDLGSATIGRLSLPPMDEILISKDTMSLTPAPGTPLSVDDVAVSDLGVAHIAISPESSQPIRLVRSDASLTLTSPAWQAADLSVRKGNQHIHCKDMRITPGPLTVTGSEKRRMTLAFSSGILHVFSGTLGLGPFKADGKFDLTGTAIKGAVALRPAVHPGQLRLEIDHDTYSRAGKVALTTIAPVEFSSTSGLDKLLSGTALPVKVTAGFLQADMAGQWQKGVRPHLAGMVNISELAGSVKQVPFSGLRFQKSIDILPVLQSQKPGTLHIQTIGAAVPVDNLEGSFTLQSSSPGNRTGIAFTQLKASLMGGVVSIDPFTHSPGTRIPTLAIRARGLDLAQLIALIKVKGLEVNGRINGYLPVSLANNVFGLEAGEFTGEAEGGTIRYRPPQSQAEQSGLTAYALQALEEFHYTSLKAPVRYLQDGTLFIDVHLQGKSPRLSATRPVHLNIHTEQNLLSLLKSLRYNRTLTRDLDKQLRKHH